MRIITDADFTLLVKESLLHSFIPLFPPPLEQTPTLSSIPLLRPGLQNSCSPPPLIIPHPNTRSFLPPLIHPKLISFKFPVFLPESPCKYHLVYPHPSPFHRYPVVFVPHYFVLPSPTLLSPALLYVSVY